MSAPTERATPARANGYEQGRASNRPTENQGERQATREERQGDRPQNRGANVRISDSASRVCRCTRLQENARISSAMRMTTTGILG